MPKSSVAVVYVAGLLLAGAGSAMLRKILFQLSSVGANGICYNFVKPWFTTFEASIACSLCLGVYQLSKVYNRRSVAQNKKQSIRYTPSPMPTNISRNSSLQQPLLPNDAPLFMDQRHGSQVLVHGEEGKKPTQKAYVNGGIASKVDAQIQSVASGFSYSSVQRRTPSFSDAGASQHSFPRRMSQVEKEVIMKKHIPKNEAPYHMTMKFGKWAKGEYGRVSWKKVVKLILPGLLQQQALGIQGIGLRYVSASVSQMISGSCIIFTAVMAIVFLKRRLNEFHWGGIVLCVMGVGFVSLAQFLNESAPGVSSEMMDKWMACYGIGMTLLSQVLQAAQLVSEEGLLQDLNLHPLQVMGIEGSINFVGMVTIVLPVVYFVPGPDPTCSCEENTISTFMQLGNSQTLFWTNFVYFWTVLGTNLFGVLVTSVLGSIFRALLLTARTALVWGADLTVFYAGIGGGSIGESWTSTSYLQAIGFVVLLIGTVMYASGSSRIRQQSLVLVDKFLEKMDKTYGTSLVKPKPATSPRQPKTLPVSFSPVRSSDLVQIVGSTPPCVVNSIIEDVVSNASLRQNWTPQFKEEVGKEVKNQIVSGRVSSSLVDTLRSKSSWLLDPQDVDKKAYAGASQFVDPFLVGTPSSDINEDKKGVGRRHSWQEDITILEDKDEEQEDQDFQDEAIDEDFYNSIVGDDSSTIEGWSFTTAENIDIRSQEGCTICNNFRSSV
eukprot:TRINITY_DN2637_c0_g2_i3.p1 TRINITY_DN2637_c0_g2~~TRINITY_DN2637_c0_g2_i3.p1  ORF type:complete len:719 (-),score=52.62 TRINITY_DN2637_c0_g2_i3:352-2508(-)